MHKPRVTVKDVARKAGVSVSAVSFALNDTGSIGESVKQRVREVARELGYRPNRSAQAMRTGKTWTLGLILPDLRNPFFPELAQSVENAAREKGYAVFLVDTNVSTDIEREAIERLAQRGVDGILCFPTTQADTIAPYADELPVVVMDREFDNYDRIIPDHRKGGLLQAEHILQQGHRHIGLVTGPLDIDNMRLRRDGAVDTLTGQAEIVWEHENPFSANLIPAVLDSIKARSVTAIIAGNDILAIAVIQALGEAGIRVPQDVSVVGFDDIPWCTVVSPPLTTIRLPIDGIGVEAVNMLLRRIDEPDAPRLTITMDVELIVRKSVVAPASPS